MENNEQQTDAAVESTGLVSARRMIAEERWAKVIHLRDVEKLSYKIIGEQIGVSRGRAEQVYKTAKHQATRKSTPWDGLSVRARNALHNAGLTGSYPDWECDKEAIKDAIASDRLKPGRNRNYGRKTHHEVLAWLGLPQVTPTPKPTKADVIDKLKRQIAAAEKTIVNCQQAIDDLADTDKVSRRAD